MEEFAQSAKRRGLSAKSWAIVAAMVIVVILIASAISTGNHSTDSARTLFVSAEGVPVLIIKPNAGKGPPTALRPDRLREALQALRSAPAIPQPHGPAILFQDCFMTATDMKQSAS